MRAGIREVALRADVSAMTVSRVLNGQADKVAAPTRQRILQAVRELDYVPVAQPAAQQRRKPTRVISLVFDQLDELRDYAGTEIHVGLRDGARAHGYDLLTVLRESPDWAGEREEVRFLDRRSDGLIFINPFRRYALMEKLVRHDIPMVKCCGAVSPEGVAVIEIDTSHAIRALVGHLYEAGHRRIGFIAGPPELGAAGRQTAFVESMAALSLPCPAGWLFNGTAPDSWVPDKEAIDATVEEAVRGGLTALACANDYLAAAAIRSGARHDIRIPDELAITGFDDVPLSERRGITTVHHPFAEVGRLAVEALIGMLNGRGPAEVSRCFETNLVVRESTAPGMAGISG